MATPWWIGILTVRHALPTDLTNLAPVHPAPGAMGY